VRIDGKNIMLALRPEDANKEVDIYLGDTFLLSATASKKSMIKISKQHGIGRTILKTIDAGEKLEIRGA
jgi:predicted PilT family ATPase